MSQYKPYWIPSAMFAAAASTAPVIAFGADYLSVEQAQKVMFPDATAFVTYPVTLTGEQRKALVAQAGTSINTASWSVFSAKAGDILLGYVITDAVIGKFQLINYAVAFGTDGDIKDVEILSYRESHGGEVRTSAWRKQFEGKTGAAPLRLGEDIRGISGATMSCSHVTEGVKRLAVYAQTVLTRR